MLQRVKTNLGTITDRSGAKERVEFAVLVFDLLIVPPYDALVYAGKQEAGFLHLKSALGLRVSVHSNYCLTYKLRLCQHSTFCTLQSAR